MSLAVAIWSGPLYRLCSRAAADLLEPASYLGAVLS